MNTYIITLVNMFNDSKHTQEVISNKACEGLELVKASLQAPEEWLVFNVQVM